MAIRTRGIHERRRTRGVPRLKTFLRLFGGGLYLVLGVILMLFSIASRFN